MKHLFKKTLLIAFLLSFFSFFTFTNAQVTIGAGIAPQQGVLLDLKEFNDATSQNGGRSAGRGVLLPRLTLTTLNSLTDIPTANQATPLQYKGLTVYNIDNTHEGIGLYQGVNVWDGTKWNSIQTNTQSIQTSIQNIQTSIQNIQTSLPKSFIRATGSSGITLLSIGLLNNWRKMIFTQEDFDENNEYDNNPANDPTGGQFSPKQDGIYSIYAQYSIDPNFLAAGTFGVGIFRKKVGENSFTLIAEETFSNLSVSLVGVLNPPTRSVQTLLKLNKNDIVIIGISSTVSLTLLGSGSKAYVTIQQVK